MIKWVIDRGRTKKQRVTEVEDFSGLRLTPDRSGGIWRRSSCVLSPGASPRSQRVRTVGTGRNSSGSRPGCSYPKVKAAGGYEAGSFGSAPSALASTGRAGGGYRPA